MRQIGAVGAFIVLLFIAFALTDAPIPARAASNPGNLTLATGPSPQGCALGPTFMFCDQVPGTTGSPLPFLVRTTANVTSLSVSLTAVPGFSANFASGDFTISNNACSGALAANQTCEIDIGFSPTTSGLRAAAVSVTDAQGDALNFNIGGHGNSLTISLGSSLSSSPSIAQDNAFTFPGQPAGTTSSSQTFTISAGSAVTQVRVSLAATPGLESQFASSPHYDFLETDNCSALTAGSTCTATVEFTPTVVGLRSASLVATDAQGDSTTFYLAGYGSNGNGGNEAGGLSFVFITANPNTESCSQVNYFGFCNEPVGGVSADSRAFTVANVSNTQITGLTVPKTSVTAQGATAPDFTVQSSSCASVLASGATCTVTVAFTPTTSGLRQGAVAITDAQGDVATLNLAGYGDDYNITTQLPTELSVIPGNSVTFNATLTPDNVFGMNGERVTFVCPADLPANTSCVATPCPAAITPGTTVAVKVALATSSATAVVPVPAGGCSSYGPAVSDFIASPPVRQSPAANGSPLGSLHLEPAVFVFAALGAIGLLVIAFSGEAAAGRRRRSAVIVMCAGFSAAILTGCHHHGATTTTATPNAATTLTVLGNAIDANGNSLNTSRQFQITLDVVTK